jgi:Domain of unknown function (DUF4268)
MTELGRLERVDLRNIWQTEAGDFTPWLAREQNIAILSDAIGIDLEVEAQEKQVGPFRADILCKDTATNDWVLVENQLAKTDHTHLGQLMTYAAGLDTVTIIWIAAEVRDEHRAALDWLNDITNDDINFFGLEVELWRIGNSPVAPKFNVVCKPNDWTKSVSGAAKEIEKSDLTETQSLYLEFWTAFREYMESRGGLVRSTKAHPQSFQDFSIGRSGIWLSVFLNNRDSRIGVILVFGGKHAKEHFKLLEKSRDDLTKTYGCELEWNPMPEKKQSNVRIVWDGADPSDKSKWPEQHKWIYDHLQCMHRTFSEQVKKLNASDYQAEGIDE